MTRSTATAVLAAVTLLAGLLGAGCATSPAPATDPPVLGAQRVDHGFVLSVAIPHLDWPAGEPIEVATTLTWTGAADTARIWGSGSGIVSFAFREIGGAGRTMAPAGTDDCVASAYVRGQPVMIPFSKSGGWSGDDPNAAFYEQWFAERALRLPAGRWEMVVLASGMLAPCDANAPQLALRLDPIVLEVR